MTGDGAARRQLAALLRGPGPAGATRVLAVCGPLGVGKSRLLADLTDADATGGPRGATREPTAPPVLVLDGVDNEPAAVAARERSGGVPPGTVVVVAGRRPVTTWPCWADVPVRTVRLAPWAPGPVRALARDHGVTRPDQVDAVVSLSGGLPLIAACLCRALDAGT
ncbi:MAG: hypothetical protein WCA46_24505, partial [Actinocatenispora sp.]